MRPALERLDQQGKPLLTVDRTGLMKTLPLGLCIPQNRGHSVEVGAGGGGLHEGLESFLWRD